MIDLRKLLLLLPFIALVSFLLPAMMSTDVLPVTEKLNIGKSGAEAGECRFESDPVLIQNKQGSFLQFWIEAERPVFEAMDTPSETSLLDFRERISGVMDTDPYSLLRNQIVHVTGPDSINVQFAIKGEAGTIRTMNCLEALLFAEQAARSIHLGYTMYTNPTEFLSYILTRDGMQKIYFYTVDQPGIRGLSLISEMLEKDRADGWQVVRNIHNHNFFPDSEMVLGGVVPSATDIQAFRNAADYFGLTGAAITNGFHTMDISAEDFRRFFSWED